MSDERCVLEIVAARHFAHSIFLLVFCANFAVHIVFLFVISQLRIRFHPTAENFLAFVWFDAVDELLELGALSIALAWAASAARGTKSPALTYSPMMLIRI